jgi:peptide/nickel transport system permease protein
VAVSEPNGPSGLRSGALERPSGPRSGAGAAPLAAPSALVAVPGGPRRLPTWVAVLAPIGVAVLVAGLLAGDRPTAVQWGLVIVGLVAIRTGLIAAGQRIWGPGWDLGYWMAVVWFGLVVGAAVFADVLPLAEHENTAAALAEPIRARPDLLSEHPLGTDTQGLDILGGVVYGARISLQVSLGAVAIGLVVGGIIGVSAGFFRGVVDSIFGFVTDSFLAFPPLILLLAVVSAVTPDARNIALALAVLTVPTFARLARANTLTFAQREFVLAARAMGSTSWRIITRELVPNVVRPLLSYAFLIVAVLVVAEASLSFLGVGIRRPTPTWGNMIAAGEREFQDHPHLVFIPGTVMFLTVFAVNRIGDRLRARWDAASRSG